MIFRYYNGIRRFIKVDKVEERRRSYGRVYKREMVTSYDTYVPHWSFHAVPNNVGTIGDIENRELARK